MYGTSRQRYLQVALQFELIKKQREGEKILNYGGIPVRVETLKGDSFYVFLSSYSSSWQTNSTQYI